MTVKRNRVRSAIQMQERDNFHKELGNRLRMARKAKNYNQEELAEWLGITGPAYSAKERGDTGFSGNDIRILCKKLNVTPNYIYGWATENRDREAELVASMEELRRKMSDYFMEVGATGEGLR